MSNKFLSTPRVRRFRLRQKLIERIKKLPEAVLQQMLNITKDTHDQSQEI